MFRFVSKDDREEHVAVSKQRFLVYQLISLLAISQAGIVQTNTIAAASHAQFQSMRFSIHSMASKTVASNTIGKATSADNSNHRPGCNQAVVKDAVAASPNGISTLGNALIHAVTHRIPKIQYAAAAPVRTLANANIAVFIACTFHG